MERARGDESIDTLADLAVALHDHAANTVRLALAAAAFADRGDWALDGSVSMTAWLRAHLRMLDNDSHELLRAGRFYARSAPFAAAVTDGTLSAGQATLMRRAIRPDTETIFDQQHTELVDILAPLDLAHTKIACHTWRARADAIADPEPRPVAPTALSHAVDDNGQACGRFVLSPHGTLHFERALTLATHHDGTNDTRTPTERRAHALEDICAFFTANHDRTGTPRHRPHLELVEEPDGTIHTIDGQPLDQVCADTLLCDCVIHRVLKTGSAILDYGLATRTVPLHLFRAVALRDGGCRFPGCDRPVAWTEAHHVQFWRHRGPTKLHNLALFCSRHHHTIHRPGWTATLAPDATLTITTPTGETLTSQPRGSPPTFTLAA